MSKFSSPPGEHEPDETVSVGATSALPGSLAILPRAAEPNVLVSHGDCGGFNFASETLQSLSQI